MEELVGEDCSDYGLVVGIMGEVHEDGVVADVGVLCRVNPCEVLPYWFSMRAGLCAGDREVSARGI